ncbi:hypothetical protein DM01DRAFT_1334505 [Hesseltinella vesiculosa]|uniref:Galactose oxidase n=1 Tax=Hesseltinella vesiculosa TaxID=101127 RepID=A0A1X2GM76_9FUNG|nr:hypothetical protein DM01DRAFT_1334505 [Hesseltinella vesiculosa]
MKAAGCTLLLSLSVVSVFAQNAPRAMYKQGCELLGTKIHCFGGAQRDMYSPTPLYQDTFLSDHFVLDLTNFHTASSDAANLQWQAVPAPSNGYQLEARADFAQAKVSENSFIVFGGVGPTKGYSTGRLTNVTSVYFADSNTWQTVDTTGVISDSPVGKQSFGGKAVYDGTSNIYFFGGTGPDYTANCFNLTNELMVVKSGNPQWTQLTSTAINHIPPASNSSWYEFPDMYPYTIGRDLTLAGDGNIYGLGGLLYLYGLSNVTGNTNGYTGQYTFFDEDHPFGSLYYKFNVANTTGNYTNSITATVYPSARSYATFSYLPGTHNILLYGGTNINVGSESSTPVSDYCYTLDYTTGIWTKLAFQGGDPGPRYGHSAIVYKDSVFIMFGANASNMMQSSVYILNTSTLVWTMMPAANNSNSTAPGSTGGGGGSPSLSAGAIAGIAVGAVAGVGLVGALLFFMNRSGVFDKRKRRDDFTAPVFGEANQDHYTRPTDAQFERGGFAAVNPHGPSTVSDTYEVMSSPTATSMDDATLVKPTEMQSISGHTDYSNTIRPSEYDPRGSVVKPTEFDDTAYLSKPHGDY